LSVELKENIIPTPYALIPDPYALIPFMNISPNRFP